MTVDDKKKEIIYKQLINNYFKWKSKKILTNFVCKVTLKKTVLHIGYFRGEMA